MLVSQAPLLSLVHWWSSLHSEIKFRNYNMLREFRMKLMRISTRPFQGDRVCIRGSKYSLTLVFLIVVQQTLLIFYNFPTFTPLFQPALLLDFKNLKQKP